LLTRPWRRPRRFVVGVRRPRLRWSGLPGPWSCVGSASPRARTTCPRIQKRPSLRARTLCPRTRS